MIKIFPLLFFLCLFNVNTLFSQENQLNQTTISNSVQNTFSPDKEFAKIEQGRCITCGMYVSKSETPYLIILKNGKNRLACGINCAILYRKMDKENVTAIMTQNCVTKKWIYVEKTFFVEGSNPVPKGTMYPFVWSFDSKKAAQKFIKQHGGKILTYDETLKILPCNTERTKSN